MMDKNINDVLLELTENIEWLIKSYTVSLNATLRTKEKDFGTTEGVNNDPIAYGINVAEKAIYQKILQELKLLLGREL